MVVWVLRLSEFQLCKLFLLFLVCIWCLGFRLIDRQEHLIDKLNIKVYLLQKVFELVKVKRVEIVSDPVSGLLLLLSQGFKQRWLLAVFVRVTFNLLEERLLLLLLNTAEVGRRRLLVLRRGL